MEKKKHIIALMYDFDKTLCAKDMQEYSFIPNIGMKADEFWFEANKISVKNNMDRILAYMYLLISKAKENDASYTKTTLRKHGKTVKYFDGVETYFNLINKYAKQKNVKIAHYIISSGTKEKVQILLEQDRGQLCCTSQLQRKFSSCKNNKNHNRQYCIYIFS